MNLPVSEPSAQPPPALRPGDTIGIVAPARWLEPDTLAAGAKRLAGDRFRVKFADQTTARHGQFAGDDDTRARAIDAMFADPDIAAIVCAKGGYGSPRIVDRLDYASIRRHPKRFVGYSDVTALLLAIGRQAGIVTYHGPMLVDLAGGLDADSLAHLLASLTDEPRDVATAALLAPAVVLRPGTAEGRLVGGNLSLLVGMIGTRSDFDTASAILFFEDVDEPLYHIDRMLVHLHRAGKLAGIAGLLIGEMTQMRDGTVPFGATVEQMVLGLLGDRAIPIVTNFPCGHGARQMTLPIGATVRLVAAADRITSFAPR